MIVDTLEHEQAPPEKASVECCSLDLNQASIVTDPQTAGASRCSLLGLANSSYGDLGGDETMNAKSINPAGVGLAAFALTTWLLSMINAGWYSSDAMGMVLAVALTFGGSVQTIAGLIEIPRGNTFGATAFLSYGAFWWSFALFALFLHEKVPASFAGWYLFLWGAFTFYMWIATFRSSRALQMLFFALFSTFFVLAVSEWTAIAWLHRTGGYLGMLTALIAFYLSAAEVINDAYGRGLLPVGNVRETVNSSRQDRPSEMPSSIGGRLSGSYSEALSSTQFEV